MRHHPLRAAMLITTLASMTMTATAAEHTYRLEFEAGLEYVRVRAQLALPGLEVRAREGVARRAEALVGCGGETLGARDRRITLPPEVDCLTYRHALPRLEERGSARVPRGIVVTAPDEWLFLPALEEGDAVRLSVVLPPENGLSTPWVEVDGGFELRASPESSRAIIVVGAFVRPAIELGSERVDYALLARPGAAIDTTRISHWLAAALGDVQGVYGRLPNPAVQIVVVPVSPQSFGDDSPVPFGHVIRDGGESVRFFVNAERSLDDLLGDWTATHEFAHLLLPYVDARWISEGFASYYQNVLLARRGVYTEAEAWTRLADSFRRAAAISDPPSPNGAHVRSFWQVRMLIYWSGAAVALLADAALRERSGGTESLDQVLGALQRCCLPSARSWRGEELFAQLDRLTDHPVFVDLYRAHANTPGMPDYSDVFRRLGIQSGERGLTLDDGAPGAWVRRAITAPSPAALAADAGHDVGDPL